MAVPGARDAWQSRFLVAVVVGVLLVAYLPLCRRMGTDNVLWQVIVVSAGLAILVWALRAATAGAAACGGLICFAMTYSGRREPWDGELVHTAVSPLIVLFALTFLATRAGRLRKERRGFGESRRGRRSSQVAANLGVAALTVAVPEFLIGGLRPLNSPVRYGVFAACLGALAEATADTVSSEIGQALGGTVVLITTGRSVPRGTDGGVSLSGSVAGMVGAALVVWAGRLWLGSDWSQVEAAAFTGGVVGLIADSLLGATLERRGWIGNDWVNFISTGVAAGVAGAQVIWLQR